MKDNSSDAIASPMTYRQKLNAIAAKFERMDVGIGHAYALQEASAIPSTQHQQRSLFKSSRSCERRCRDMTAELTVIPAWNGVETYRMSTDAASISKAIVLKTALEIEGRKYVRVEGWQAIAIAHGCTASSGDVHKVEGELHGHRPDSPHGYRRTIIAQAEGFVAVKMKSSGSAARSSSTASRRSTRSAPTMRSAPWPRPAPCSAPADRRLRSRRRDDGCGPTDHASGGSAGRRKLQRPEGP